MKTIEEFQSRQTEIRSRLQEMDSEYAGVALPDDARSEWNALNEEFESGEVTISELIGRRDRVAALERDPESREDEPEGLHTPHVKRPGATRDGDIYDLSSVRSTYGRPEEAGAEFRDRAKRAIEQATFPHEKANRETCQSHVERLVETVDGPEGKLSRYLLETGSPTYKRAFSKMLAGAPCSAEESRALSSVGKEGGFAVPFTLDPTIVPTSNYVLNPIRELADVKPITTETWKGVTSAGVTAAYSGEAEEATDGSPELAQPEISAQRADVFVPYSIEIEGDWSGLQAELAKLIQESKDVLEATAFLTGSGTKQPFGVLTGATELIETVTAATFAVADVYALKDALPARFKPRAAWLAADAIYDRIRQFDTAGGASLWVRLPEGRPTELIGKQVAELSTMATAVDKTEAKVLTYGDFSYYVIVERLGMQVELVPTVFGPNQRPTGQRGLYAIWRNGAKVLSKNAFRTLKVKKE